MPNAERILAGKQQTLVTIGPSATILDAARLMNDHHIGSLVVLDGQRLAGIFTERDVMRRVVAEQRDPGQTKVSEVMTTVVACATSKTSTEEMRKVMREKHIRHLPVVDGKEVRGMISIGDLNRVENAVQEQTIQYLERYLSVS